LPYKLLLTEPELEDAQEYAAYIQEQNQSSQAANRCLDGLVEAVAVLRDSPLGFALIPESEELGSPYRDLVYYSHRVIDGVDEEQRVVTVYRIYHGARTLSSRDIP